MTALGNAYFGQGVTLLINLDEVGCVGYEPNITECSHTSIHNCDHLEDAGVRCLAATPPPPGTISSLDNFNLGYS